MRTTDLVVSSLAVALCCYSVAFAQEKPEIWPGCGTYQTSLNFTLSNEAVKMFNQLRWERDATILPRSIRMMDVAAYHVQDLALHWKQTGGITGDANAWLRSWSNIFPDPFPANKKWNVDVPVTGPCAVKKIATTTEEATCVHEQANKVSQGYIKGKAREVVVKAPRPITTLEQVNATLRSGMDWSATSKFEISHDTLTKLSTDLTWMGDTTSNDPLYAGCGVRGMFISCWVGQGQDYTRCVDGGAVYNRVSISILAAMVLPLLRALA
eukprot:GHVU01126748.1.p1 GENE.GHVU01126748.1~~GHVU01126748.1.p1  ORF type:complete len:268 (+),score=29.73 GHVU01126748.1:82-885(+)